MAAAAPCKGPPPADLNGEIIMGDRIHITLGCTVCKNKNYHFARGKKQESKIELNKFCRACGKQTPHKEVKS
jgi:large subunit ribosomal protein L33